ncbi:hypothetical protein FKW77_009474 [Venturia effusa]|uniref:Uncharacterized protein n=1 Tax=Venturia effusa TaxID=50376 RepID=A0A517LD57_9PEZI|nr:hypothetical protein FKW77_009474 [Venturia effusa]
MAEPSLKRPRIDSPALDEGEQYIQRGIQSFSQIIRDLKADVERELSARAALDGEVERIDQALTTANAQAQRLSIENKMLQQKLRATEEELGQLKQESVPNQQLKDKVRALEADLSRANRFIEQIRNADEAFRKEEEKLASGLIEFEISETPDPQDGGEVKDGRCGKGGNYGGAERPNGKVSKRF